MPRPTTKKRPKPKPKDRHSRAWRTALQNMRDYEIVEKETEADPEEGRLRCPHKDCQGEFVVNRSKWKELKHAGRACPYCFRASRVPGRKYPEEIHGATH